MTGRIWLAGLLAVASMQAAPATAEVALLKDDFFVSRHTQTVNASSEDVWNTLLSPSDWWNGEHSFSGDPENLILDARAGGCFCEMLPVGEGRTEPGSVRHLEVIFVDPGKAMRLTGALGPLQSEPLMGVLTVTLKPIDDGTRILFEYAVGGPSRFDQATIAPAVDSVIGEQLTRLAAVMNGATLADLAEETPSVRDEPSAADEDDRPSGEPSFGAETRAVPVIVATDAVAAPPQVEPSEPVTDEEGAEAEAEADEQGIGADFLSGT